MVVVSVALPVYNAEKFLEQCFESILVQKKLTKDDHHQPVSYSSDDALKEDIKDPSVFADNASAQRKGGKLEVEIEVSVYDDGSSDSSPSIIDKWGKIFDTSEGFLFCSSRNDSSSPKGVGFARNRTIAQSTGEYLCFCDADDIMAPMRILRQFELCLNHPNAIVGSKFTRIPADSTKNFTFWANSLEQEQLKTQIYLSFGPSVVMPTWFCRRSVYDRVQGGFNEAGKGTPEDLLFFYDHLDHKGDVVRADEELIMYRYHPSATTFSVSDEVIRNIRHSRLEAKVLVNWNTFSIWNAGKLGRRFYRSLTKQSRDKVSCLCDVDKKKISQKWYHPYPIKVKIPIVHVMDASPPFVICVKTEMTYDPNSDFRKLLDSLNLKEGMDYFYFN